MTTDPRSHGLGAGDVVDVVVRGRVTRCGAASMTLRVETAPHLSPGGVATVDVWIPAESIVSAALTEDPACGACNVPRSRHADEPHEWRARP